MNLSPTWRKLPPVAAQLMRRRCERSSETVWTFEDWWINDQDAPHSERQITNLERDKRAPQNALETSA